jgi:uncharacterized DUF497 family protein
VKTFRWHEWNLAKVAKHGVSPLEAERVVIHASRPYPKQNGGDKWLVIGRGQGDRFMEVVYLVDDDDTIFIIHAMPLTTRRRRSGR